MRTYRPNGFTMVELVIAIVIGAVLMTIAVRSFSSTTMGMSVRQASQNFQGLHARARAHAIERGENIRLWATEDGDSVWIADAAGDRIDVFRFYDELGVELGLSMGSSGFICFTPRGVADPDCSTTDQTVTVRFNRAGDADSLQVLPLGQLRS